MHTENTFLKVIHTLAGRWPVRHIPWTITWNTRCTHIKIQNHIVNFDHNGRSYNLRVPGVPAVIIIFRPASASLSSSFLLPLYRCAMISFRISYLLQSVVIFQSFAGVDWLDRQIRLTEFGVTFCTSICWNVARFFFFCVGRLVFLFVFFWRLCGRCSWNVGENNVDLNRDRTPSLLDFSNFSWQVNRQ